MNPSLITTTQAVDPVFKFIFGASIILLFGITAATVTFVIRYRRSRAPEPTSLTSTNIWLEIVWTALPTVLVMAMFYYGWSGYLSLRNVPKDALEVTATARMWSWNFTYANGKSSPKLYVPVGKPVVVNLVSQDVLHGFFIPAFRVKRDVVPGMKNHVWFVAERAGSYDLFCSVYCGTGHSNMISTVEAVTPAAFAAWLQQEGGAEHGGKELLEKLGCLGCHSLDGSRGVGPTFKGLYNSRVKVRQNGRLLTVTADDAYLRESIRAPAAKVVDGFQPVMPAFGDLKDEEVAALVEFIEGVR
ncbi:MAG TPA: cytochrome c oxidase subunit II [Geobacteraceae bacterium]